MKQGSGNSRRGDGKVEPMPHAINPRGVAAIGIKQVYTNGAPSLMSGRGYKAPAIESTTHKSGTQGKH